MFLECLPAMPIWKHLHIDSAVASAHQHSAGAEQSGPEQEEKHIGRSHSGNTTKIHALVDSLGNPITFMLTAGNRHDSPVTLDLVKGSVSNWGQCAVIRLMVVRLFVITLLTKMELILFHQKNRH